MHDVQNSPEPSPRRRKIAEMQTGEGKTLAAVTAAAWLAREGKGVPRHDRERLPRPPRRRWMGGVYEALGLHRRYIIKECPRRTPRAYENTTSLHEATNAASTSSAPQLASIRPITSPPPFHSAGSMEADSIQR